DGLGNHHVSRTDAAAARSTEARLPDQPWQDNAGAPGPAPRNPACTARLTALSAAPFGTSRGPPHCHRDSSAYARFVVAELGGRQQDVAHHLGGRRQAMRIQAWLLCPSANPLERLLDLGICGARRDDCGDHAVVEIANQVTDIVSRQV